MLKDGMEAQHLGMSLGDCYGRLMHGFREKGEKMSAGHPEHIIAPTITPEMLEQFEFPLEIEIRKRPNRMMVLSVGQSHTTLPRYEDAHSLTVHAAAEAQQTWLKDVDTAIDFSFHTHPGQDDLDPSDQDAELTFKKKLDCHIVRTWKGLVIYNAPSELKEPLPPMDPRSSPGYRSILAQIPWKDARIQLICDYMNDRKKWADIKDDIFRSNPNS